MSAKHTHGPDCEICEGFCLYAPPEADALPALLAAKQSLVAFKFCRNGVLWEEHDEAALELVNAAITTPGSNSAERAVPASAADLSAYGEYVKPFHNFWYAHMSEDQMQPPLSGVSYAQALYIWNACKCSPQQQEVTACKCANVGECDGSCALYCGGGGVGYVAAKATGSAS